MIGAVLPAQPGDVVDVITGPLKQQIGQRRKIVAASRPVIEEMPGIFLQRFFRRVFVFIMVVDIIINILRGPAVFIQNLIQLLRQLLRQVSGGLGVRRSGGRGRRCDGSARPPFLRFSGQGRAVFAQRHPVHRGIAGQHAVGTEIVAIAVNRLPAHGEDAAGGMITGGPDGQPTLLQRAVVQEMVGHAVDFPLPGVKLIIRSAIVGLPPRNRPADRFSRSGCGGLIRNGGAYRG